MEIDLKPNPRRLAAVWASGGIFVPGLGTLHYSEYGGGAEMVNDEGWVIMDFPSHLNAEKFIKAMERRE